MHRINHTVSCLLAILLLASCEEKVSHPPITLETFDSSYARIEIDDNPNGDTLPGKMELTTPNTTTSGGAGADTAHAEHIISHALGFLGIPYKYASANPLEGFDCSGFLYFVFSHFNIEVPRSSKDYMDYGKEIPSTEAKPGDFILFTGTDSSIRNCGHVGLITGYDNKNIQFIHSSSGKANGVTITTMNDYYRTRYMQCRRILKNN